MALRGLRLMPTFLLSLLPHLRKALPYILLSVALIGGYWWQARYHYGRGVEATESRWEAKWAKAEAEARARAEALDAAYRASEADRARLAALVRNLPPPPPPRTLIREVPTDAPVNSCPRLSPAFRLRWNADPADPGTGAAGLVSE